MKDPAIAFSTLLAEGSLGTFAALTGWSLNVGSMPISPDTVILCNKAGGLTPHPALLLNQPSLQIIVRGARNGYVMASDKMRDIVDYLLGLENQTVDNDVYRSITQIGDIAYLGHDENTRPLFSSNFRAIVLPEASATTHRVPIA